SPAFAAGLRPGDLVMSLDGKPLDNGRQFQVRLYRHAVDDVVSLDILREQKTLKIRVAIVERPEHFGGIADSVDPRANLVPRLGILGLDLDRRIAEMIPAVRVPYGVVVASTVDGAIDVREGGLAAGDVIFAINRKPISGLAELRAALEA